MSVFVISEKAKKGFILSVPTLEMAREQIRGLYKIDKELGDYEPDRYGVYEREYCPTYEFDCPDYMMGICAQRYPDIYCKNFMEAANGVNA